MYHMQSHDNSRDLQDLRDLQRSPAISRDLPRSPAISRDLLLTSPASPTIKSVTAATWRPARAPTRLHIGFDRPHDALTPQPPQHLDGLAS